jgi:type III restriction enzyme
MSEFEVPEPILNSPFEEPREHWRIQPGEEPVRVPGRRAASYFYRPPGGTDEEGPAGPGTLIELRLVNRIRERVKLWREASPEPYPGVSRTTLELLRYWRRDGRERRLFFAQLEAAETAIFLTEARGDFLQSLEIPPDEPGEDRRAEGFTAWRRIACKMATGSGKTTVMGMLAAWSILNKVSNRADGRFSDTVLIVCPNVRTGRRVLVRETVNIGAKTTKARGSRYLTPEELDRQLAAGLLSVLHEERDAQGHLKRVEVQGERFVESDASVVARVLGREVGGKQNILVLNDEAHHAYRIRRPEAEEQDLYEDEDEAEEFYKEATVWVDGLDRVHKLRGINFCIDFSATPYFLGGVGQETNRPFPWVVSEFGLTDAIESGLVKIPQLAVRDASGAEVPGFFNIWRWILPRLTAAERGTRKGSPKPEAILKWAHTPIAMLGGSWQEELQRRSPDDPRPPVFIIVCKNTRIAKVVYEWLAEGQSPHGIPPANIDGFRNREGERRTIRVDTRVVGETDTGEAKGDEDRWMRFTLDTVGRLTWPLDRQGRPVCPEGFEELAGKLKRPLHPPGRDVRCVVSVGMLTEGWDCSTVTHVIGLRPFHSQLLCEQVVGRALRRFSYDVGPDGRLSEEVAKVLGVPFEIVPFKKTEGAPHVMLERRHVHAIPSKAAFEVRFPRVEGYRQAIRNRITVDWDRVPPLWLDPLEVPPEVQVKAALPANQGRLSLLGPGKLEDVTLSPFRSGRRQQELVFELTRDLTRDYFAQGDCEVPAQVLFPQVARIVARYLAERVHPKPPANRLDVFLAPYYGWAIEVLLQAIQPDRSAGEAPELPRYEVNRDDGSTADVDFWTTREVCEVVKSHVNYVVADTPKWEQSAAYQIDRHPRVEAFVKNAGLGFAIPYLHNGQPHDYQPDFLVRIKTDPPFTLILETKGYDPLAEVKAAAAQRWVEAVNAEGRHSSWAYVVARDPSAVPKLIDGASLG